MRAAVALPLLVAALALAAEARADEAQVVSPSVRRAPQPDEGFGFRQVKPQLTFAWLAFQLVPSPEVVVGRQRAIDFAGNVDASPSVTWGLRWQLTPLLWSFGVHRAQSRWRTFVVDPIARHAGSIELSTAFEYLGGHVDLLLVRPGLRAYLPLAQKGEYLSASLGTSVYAYDGLRVAYDVGLYTLGGLFGVQVTVAPTHAPLAAIGTFRIRYF